MTGALTDRKNRKRRMRRILLIGLLLSLLCAGTGCAKKQAADDVVRDIVPENGIGADGMPAGEPGRDDEAVSTSGGADAAGKGQETAQVGLLTLTLPAGYQQSTTSGLYLNQNYPDDQSNVYIYTTEKTTDFEQVMTGGQEQFIGYLADAYEQQYEERPEITLTRYEAASIGEKPAYVVEISYDLKGVHYEQLEYIVDADKTYYIAFSQVGARSWMEAFYDSAGTMFFSEAE
ncbi:MAG: hypothetical protein K2K87_03490 [Lachnospiraceae bacterium]|nr:hypothetical protein [Lachnospiraceae bacterium]